MARVSVRDARAERLMAPAAPLLLRVLRENYRGGAWHGPAVLTALRDLEVAGARWRPGPGRHSIWELTIHLAYARHIMLRRMGLETPAFPHRLTKAWWPSAPAALTPGAWKDELALLDTLHGELVAAVSGAGRRLLGTVRPRRNLTLAMEVLGVATHDAYHAGQMQMIRRMWESRGKRSGR
jgi:uncharacterized damage-inducible protein DinB